MELSDSTRIMMALTLIVIPTIEYGGVFLLSQMGRKEIIRTEIQRSYFRAGHAHAGVLVLLGLFGQLLVDMAALNIILEWLLRIGFFVAPMFVSAGFFVGAPMKEGDSSPGRLIILVRIGAILLAACLLALGVGLLV